MKKEYIKPEIDAYDFHRKTDLILTDSTPTIEEEPLDEDTPKDIATNGNVIPTI